MKVLVCGGRNYANYLHVESVLDSIHSEHRITHLIHGGANGADALASEWASKRGIQDVQCSANWRIHGITAGPRRNRRMLDLGPDLVVAFPGGAGTAHMVSIAKTVGVLVSQPVECSARDAGADHE
jgi:YspA, cpYpsA-related SLOG family